MDDKKKVAKRRRINHRKPILPAVAFLERKNDSLAPPNVKNSSRRSWRASRFPFFALGKFTADFEGDVARTNAVAGNYCLRH
jgi:hypothetical protein